MGVSVEWLFPESLYKLNLPNRVERTYQSPELLTLQQAHARKLLGDSESPEKEVVLRELREELNKQLGTLKPRAAYVLRERFGLNEKGEQTVEEIAQELHISRKCIRQIEDRGLRKLIHPKQSRPLRPFIELERDL